MSKIKDVPSEFWCTYEIERKVLFLKNMTLNGAFENYVQINEAMPIKEGLNVIYNDINLPVSFTGKFRLAKDNKSTFSGYGLE